MHKLKEKIKNELMEYEEKVKKSRDAKLTPGELQIVHMLTDTLKNIEKIEGLENGGYSQATDFMGEGRMYGHSYGYHGYPVYYRDDGMSRDGMAYDDGGSSYARHRDSMGRYSREDGREHMTEKLRGMMEDASSEKEREAIRRCMSELERV